MYFFCCASKEDEDETRAAAATRIQSVHRGYVGRKKADDYRNGAVDGTEDLGSQNGSAGKLMKITITSATNLRNVVRGVTYRAKSSPFVKCDVGGVTFSTKVVPRNLSPKWNESFECVDVADNTPIIFEVFHPAVKKTPEISLGSATLSFLQYHDGCETTLDLDDPGSKKKKKATLAVKVEWVTPQARPGRISAFMDQPAETWIVRYKAIGLRHGPGVAEQRVNIDLQPGEQFEVVEVVEGTGGQEYLRLKDGRGWAFSVSPKSGETLCERVVEKESAEIEDEGDAAADNEEGAAFEEADREPEGEEVVYSY